jgi:vibriolysin
VFWDLWQKENKWLKGINMMKVLKEKKLISQPLLLLVFVLLGVSGCGGGSNSKGVVGKDVPKDIPIDIPDENPLFTGNAWLSGPGGDEEEQWNYDGIDRPFISIKRIEGLCTFDNGLVSVTDMQNERDEAWHGLQYPRPANQPDEVTFPPYSFLCDKQPFSDYRKVMDGEYVWTYSNVNDAMFYGNIVYDTFKKYLGEPGLDHKIRLRVHYAGRSRDYAFWDGAYANFSDAFPFYYSMLSLDSVAHEVGHGVLNRISTLNSFEREISTDARTLHEAFGDISGLMAKYEFTGHTDNWIHGEKIYGFSRHLNKIQTESGAIESLLDYDDAGSNYYLRIGMMTYPFYVLTNEWGIETAYDVYVSAAKNCWSPMTDLTQAAACIQLAAEEKGLSKEIVTTAFKTVKIKLFDDGVLSHFYVESNVETSVETNAVDNTNASIETNSLSFKFIDNSQSTNQVIDWHWDFGDGTESNMASPQHVYTQAGTYTIRLTVEDQSGDSDYFERSLEVAH